MKKNIAYGVIILLVLLQSISFFQIESLRRQTNNSQNSINNLNNRIQNDMNIIYANVGEMLRREAAIIENASVELESSTVDGQAIPLTYTLTPKVVSADTTVSLGFDGELFPMERDGTTFTVTVFRDIFGDSMPEIVIVDDGITKTTHDSRLEIWSLKELLLPGILYTMLDGRSYHANGNYIREGKLRAYFEKPVWELGAEFVETRFIVEVDDEIISTKPFPIEALSDGFEIKESIPLREGQSCKMTLVATDSLGFEHHYLIDHTYSGYVPTAELPMWPFEEYIYSADGELLWSLEEEYRKSSSSPSSLTP